MLRPEVLDCRVVVVGSAAQLDAFDRVAFRPGPGLLVVELEKVPRAAAAAAASDEGAAAVVALDDCPSDAGRDVRELDFDAPRAAGRDVCPNVPRFALAISNEGARRGLARRHLGVLKAS